MPHYSYECKTCHHRLDVFQTITEKPLTQCPHCKENSLQREIGGQEVFLQCREKTTPRTNSCHCCSAKGCSHRDF